MKRTVKRVLALTLAFMMIMNMQCFVFAAETVSDVIYDESAAETLCKRSCRNL